MDSDINITQIFADNHPCSFLLQALPLGIIYLAEDTSVQFANKEALEILGLTLEQIQGITPLDPYWKTIKEDGSEYPNQTHPSMLVFQTGEEVKSNIMGVYNARNQEMKWIKINAFPFKKIYNGNVNGVIVTFLDITQEKKSKDSEKENAEKLEKAYIDLRQKQFAIDQHAIVAVTNLEGKITYANDKFCKLSKYSKEEILGKDHRIINSGYHSRFFFQELYKTIHSGNIWRGEIRNRAKNGSFYWVDTTIVPLQDKNGNIEQFVSIRTDITEQKKIQEELRFSESTIRVLLNSNTHSVLFIDPNKKIQFFNSMAKQNIKLVYNREVTYSESIDQYIFPEDKELFNTAFQASLTGSVFQIEKFYKIDGDDYWFEFQFAPVKNQNELVIGVLLTVNDINERKQLDRKLAQSELRFRTIFEQAPMGIALVNSYSGKPIQFNQKFSYILGYEYDEIFSKENLNLIHTDDTENFKKNMELLNSGKLKLLSMELRFLRKDKSIIWTNLTCLPLWTEEDKVRLNLRILIDITDRKNHKVELNHYLSELENLNNTKDKFFSIIAHDLRNPFTGIISLSDLLENKLELEKNESSSEILKYIQMIKVSSKSAFNLLENLLHWAKSQTGSIKLNPQTILLKKTLNTSITLISGNAFRKNITIENNVPDDIRIFTDESLVSTILRNLLTNAIKFSYQNGIIVVSTKIKNDFLEISISDSGVGIDSSNIEKIFKIDSKFSKPGTENEKGTGLGLVLCKEFTELLGGKIWATSELGVGSTFTFSLPLKEKP